jgi:hypothetical protein
MAVHQTREFFMNRDGCIVDNKEVGPTLAEQMWSPGNSEAFLDLVKRLTGVPLSGKAWVQVLEQHIDDCVAEERDAYDMASRAEAEQKGDDLGEEKIDLDMRVRIVDGDDVIADTAIDRSFLASCARFEKYIELRYR